MLLKSYEYRYSIAYFLGEETIVLYVSCYKFSYQKIPHKPVSAINVRCNTVEIGDVKFF